MDASQLSPTQLRIRLFETVSRIIKERAKKRSVSSDQDVSMADVSFSKQKSAPSATVPPETDTMIPLSVSHSREIKRTFSDSCIEQAQPRDRTSDSEVYVSVASSSKETYSRFANASLETDTSIPSVSDTRGIKRTIGESYTLFCNPCHCWFELSNPEDPFSLSALQQCDHMMEQSFCTVCNYTKKFRCSTCDPKVDSLSAVQRLLVPTLTSHLRHDAVHMQSEEVFDCHGYIPSAQVKQVKIFDRFRKATFIHDKEHPCIYTHREIKFVGPLDDDDDDFLHPLVSIRVSNDLQCHSLNQIFPLSPPCYTASQQLDYMFHCREYPCHSKFTHHTKLYELKSGRAFNLWFPRWFLSREPCPPVEFPITIITVPDALHLLRQNAECHFGSCSVLQGKDMFTTVHGCHCIQEGTQIILSCIQRMVKLRAWCTLHVQAADGIPYYINHLLRHDSQHFFGGRVGANISGIHTLYSIYPQLLVAPCSDLLRMTRQEYITTGMKTFFRSRNLGAFIVREYDLQWDPCTDTLKFLCKTIRPACEELFMHGSHMYCLASIASHGFRDSKTGTRDRLQWGCQTLPQDDPTAPTSGLYTLELKEDPPLWPGGGYSTYTDIMGDRFFWFIYYVVSAQREKAIPHSVGPDQYIFLAKDVFIKEIRVTAMPLFEIPPDSSVFPVWVPELESKHSR